MRRHKKLVTFVIFIALLIFFACESLLHTTSHDSDNGKKQKPTEFIFVSKNKNLGDANVLFINTAGDTITERKLDEGSKLKELPAKNVYLKISQKETDNGL